MSKYQHFIYKNNGPSEILYLKLGDKYYKYSKPVSMFATIKNLIATLIHNIKTK